MKQTTSSFRLWRWTILLGLVATGVVLTAHLATVPSMATEKAALYSEPATVHNRVQHLVAQATASSKKDKKELDNQSCIDCHGPDILKQSPEELHENVVIKDKPAPPRVKPRYVFGELNLAIDEKKYGDGVHAGTTCVECHA
ncbi:MAG: hypothetical protein FJY85_02710, partial [Deltaproteobacteria bacterium]|nr:hypothetical protein [Deltaproteobacteria bacterium]